MRPNAGEAERANGGEPMRPNACEPARKKVGEPRLQSATGASRTNAGEAVHERGPEATRANKLRGRRPIGRWPIGRWPIRRNSVGLSRPDIGDPILPPRDNRCPTFARHERNKVAEPQTERDRAFCRSDFFSNWEAARMRYTVSTRVFCPCGRRTLRFRRMPGRVLLKPDHRFGRR